jgi:hypothetical protein
VIAFGAFLGLVDATIGCKISNWLDTAPANVSKNPTLERWSGMVIWAMLYGIVISLTAYLIATRPNKGEKSDA